MAQIEGTNIIEMLKGEVGSTPCPSEASEDQGLQKILGQMPLAALLGLLRRRGAVGKALEDELEVLRGRLG